MRPHHKTTARTALVTIAIVICTAACGSQEGGAAAQPADLNAAKAVIQKYSTPTRFPVDRPLAKTLAPGQRIAFLQCAAPFCALLGQLYGQATDLLGIPKVDTTKASASVDGIQSALSTVQETKPAALLLPAVNLGAVGGKVQALAADQIPIIGAGVMGSKSDGIAAPVNGPNNYKVHGTVLADWAIVQGGSSADIVLYGNPEIDFTKVITKAFKDEVAENCSSCTVRDVDIPLSTIGSTAPSRVVSDLQAHPDTDVAIFGSLETAIGLPAALRTAHIKVKVAGSAPVPSNLADMKSGGIDAAVGLDAGVLAFTQVDAAVRLATGQPLTAAEANGDIPSQLITKDDLPEDVSHGYSAYPDFVERFQKLWASAKQGG